MNATQKNYFRLIILLIIYLCAYFINLIVIDERTNGIVWSVSIIIGSLLFINYSDPEFDYFSPINIFGLLFIFLFGFPSLVFFLFGNIINKMPEINSVASVYLVKSAMLVYIGLIAFYVGYINKYPKIIASKFPLLNFEYDTRKTLKLLKLSLLISMASVSLPVFYGFSHINVGSEKTIGLTSLLSYLYPFYLLSIALLIGLSIKLKNKKYIIFLILLLLLGIITGFISGSKLSFLLPIILTIIAVNYLHKKFTRRTILILLGCGLLLLAVYYPINNIYRQVSSIKNNTQSIKDNISYTMKIVSGSSPNDLFQDGVNSFISRTSDIFIVANTLRYLEGNPPKYGKTYSLIFPGFVPRIIWREKPSLTIGDQINVELGYGAPKYLTLDKIVGSSSTGITLFGEGLINFGKVFFILPVFIIGMFIRYLHELFNNGRKINPILATGVYLYWLYEMVSIVESNIAAPFVGMIKITFLFVLIFVLFKFHFSREGHYAKH